MQQALEVVLGLAVKTMSNFTNSITGTPLDREVKNLAWRKPRVAMRRQDLPKLTADGQAESGDIDPHSMPPAMRLYTYLQRPSSKGGSHVGF